MTRAEELQKMADEARLFARNMARTRQGLQEHILVQGDGFQSAGDDDSGERGGIESVGNDDSVHFHTNVTSKPEGKGSHSYGNADSDHNNSSVASSGSGKRPTGKKPTISVPVRKSPKRKQPRPTKRRSPGLSTVQRHWERYKNIKKGGDLLLRKLTFQKLVREIQMKMSKEVNNGIKTEVR